MRAAFRQINHQKNHTDSEYKLYNNKIRIKNNVAQKIQKRIGGYKRIKLKRLRYKVDRQGIA